MKKYFLLILGLVLAVSTYASPITKEKARLNVLNFLQQIHRERTFNLNGNDVTLHLENNEKDETTNYYIFNIGEDNGFVIASANDCAVPILGYSDKGHFDLSRIPENLKVWLVGYEREIKEYKDLEKSPQRMVSSSEKTKKTIEPLIETRWDQSTPYNNKCYEQRPTGCVATAMAQVMYYHKWPQNNTSEIPAYTMEDGSENVVIPSLIPIKFDWDNMIKKYDTTYSDIEADAVAELMKYCGHSVETTYEKNASGAYSYKAATALKEYFDYDNGVTFLVQEGYTYDEWENIVYNELVNSRPVLFAGSNDYGGHEFVCDGYKNGFFHFNWGWSGMSDGFYKLSALIPNLQGIGGSEGGNKEFTYRQQIVIGIQPPVDNSVSHEYQPSSEWIALGNYNNNGHFTINSQGDVDMSVNTHFVYNGEINNCEYEVGVALFNKEGGLLKVLCSKNISFIAGYPDASRHTLFSEVSIPSEFIERYEEMYIRPVLLDDKENVEIVEHGDRDFIKVLVGDGEIITKAYPEAELVVENLCLGTMPVMPEGSSDNQIAIATIKNNGIRTISGRLDVMINDMITYLTDDNDKFYSEPEYVFIRPGEYKDVYVNFVAPEGKNKICIAFKGKPISKNIDIDFIVPNVKSAKLEVTATPEYVSQDNSIVVDLDITNKKSQSKYETLLTLELYDLESAEHPYVVRTSTQMLNIDPKETKKYTFSFNNLNFNTGYGFAIKYIDSNKVRYVGGSDYYTDAPNKIYKTYRTADVTEYWNAIGDYSYVLERDDNSVLDEACFISFPSGLVSNKFLKSKNSNCIYNLNKEDIPAEYEYNNIIKGNTIEKLHLTNDAPYFSTVPFKCYEAEIAFEGTSTLTPIYLPFSPETVVVDGEELVIAKSENDEDADCILMPLTNISSDELYFDYGAVEPRAIYMFAVDKKYEGKKVVFKAEYQKLVDLGLFTYTFVDYDVLGPSGYYLKDKYDMYVYNKGKFVRYNSDMKISEYGKHIWLKMNNGYSPDEIKINYKGSATSIDDVKYEEKRIARIFNVHGILVKSTEYAKGMLDSLPRGVYIIDGKKYIK